MAGHRQLQPAAQGEAIQHRDHRLRHFFDPPHHPRAAQREIAGFDGGEATHFGDIRPGDKGLGATAGQHDHPHHRVGRGGVEGGVQGIERGRIQCVQTLWTVNRNAADRSVAFD